MKVVVTDTFIKSFKKMIATESQWWTFWYWRGKYYDVKRAIKNLWIYFPIVIKMVPWDYTTIIRMMKFQTKILCNNIEKYSLEIDEDRFPKIEKMKRFIELAENHLEDNYYERCGWEYSKFWAEKDNDSFKIVDDQSKEQKENNIKAMKKGGELEEKEWNEMFEILKEMRGWWN